MEIVNFLYELAREHKSINGFAYGRAGGKGAGNEAFPLVWLDDPILGNGLNAVIRYTVNIDFLDIPKNDTEAIAIQSAMLLVGLSFAEQIANVRAVTGISYDGFSFVSLRDYYDNNAAGQRFTFTLIQANPVNRCFEYFDTDKQFPKLVDLPVFETEAPEGCAVFNTVGGLPSFEI